MTHPEFTSAASMASQARCLLTSKHKQHRFRLGRNNPSGFPQHAFVIMLVSKKYYLISSYITARWDS